MNEYQKVVKKAIKHFENLRNGNKVVLDKFEKDIRTGRTQGSTTIYKHRQKYYDIAIELLQEELPMKVFDNSYCPQCEKYLVDWKKEKYCPECGQRLNWEEDDD